MANVPAYGMRSSPDIESMRLSAGMVPIALSSAAPSSPVTAEADPIASKDSAALESLWDQTFGILKEKGILDVNGELFKNLRLKHPPKLTFSQIIRLNNIMDDPSVCKFKLDENGQSFEFPFLIKEYLQKLLEWRNLAQDDRFLIDDIEIVGGAVSYILGWDYFEFVLKLISENYQKSTGKTINIVELLPAELIQSIKNELSKYPKDIDIRVWMKNADAETRDELKKIQISILLKLAEIRSKTVPAFGDAMRGMFVNAMNVNTYEQLFIMSVSNRSKVKERKVDINFFQSGRQFLFDRDATGISLGPYFYKELGPFKPHSHVYDGSQFIFDRFTRRIGIRDVQSINERGWGVLQSLCLKGYRVFDKTKEGDLLTRTLKLVKEFYPSSGVFFAENLKNNIINHHDSNPIDAALLFIRYFNELQNKLDPIELKLFVNASTVFIKTLGIPANEDHPIIKGLLQSIADGSMSIQDVLASVSLFTYLCLESPNQSQNENLNLKVVDGELEMISRSKDSSYTLRLPYALSQAIDHFATKEARISQPVYKIFRQHGTYNPQKNSKLPPAKIETDNLKKLETLLTGSVAKKSVGYELLMLACQQSNSIEGRKLLLKYLGSVISVYSPAQRKEILEQLERVFVVNQQLQFPEIFNQKVKSALAEAKSDQEAKAIYFEAFSKTSLFSTSKMNPGMIHFTKNAILDIALDSMEGSSLAMEVVFKNLNILSEENKRNVGLRLLDLYIEKGEWKKALEQILLLKQYPDISTEVVARIKKIPFNAFHDPSLHSLLLNTFASYAYKEPQAWYFLFKFIGIEGNVERISEALKCLKTTVIPKDLMVGMVLGYSGMLSSLLDVLIKANDPMLLDICEDLGFYRHYFRNKEGDQYFRYLEKILDRLKTYDESQLTESQKDTLVELLDTLIQSGAFSNIQSFEVMKLHLLVSDSRKSKLMNALSPMLQYYQKYDANQTAQEEQFQDVQILLDKLQKHKENGLVNQSVACFLKVLNKHVKHQMLIKFAFEAAEFFNEEVNKEAIVLFNTFAVEHLSAETKSPEYLPSSKKFQKVFQKGIPDANDAAFKEFRNFVLDVFWKLFLKRSEIKALRTLVAEKLLDAERKNKKIEDCINSIQFLNRWAETESNQDALRFIGEMAFQPLLRLLAKHDNKDLFNKWFNDLFKSLLYNPQTLNEPYKYSHENVEITSEIAYQGISDKEVIRYTVPVITIQKDDKGLRVRDSREKEYIFFFKLFIKEAVKVSCLDGKQEFLKDVCLQNLVHFINLFSDRKEDCIELIKEMANSIEPSSEMHLRHLLNCKRLLLLSDEKGIFDQFPMDALEIGFLLGARRTQMESLDPKKVAEILLKVIEGVLSKRTPKTAHRYLLYAISIINEFQGNALIKEHMIRFQCYSLIFRVLTEIPFDHLRESKLLNILHSVIFDKNKKYLSTEKESEKANGNISCELIESLLKIVKNIPSDATLEDRKTVLSNLLVSISGAHLNNVSKQITKTYWNSFESIFNFCLGYIKDNPDRSSDVTSTFTIHLKGFITLYTNSDEKQKLSYMTRWIRSLHKLSNPVHAKVAFKLATEKATNVYCNFPEMASNLSNELKL